MDSLRHLAVGVRGGGKGVLIFMHGRSRMTVDPRAPLRCRGEARRVFTDQTDIVFADRR